MTDRPDDSLIQLQREYLAGLPVRLSEIRTGIERFRRGVEGAARALHAQFHQLAGSGGSYGFPEISAIAREAERWLAAGCPAPDAGRLEEAVDRLAAAAKSDSGR